MRWLLWVFLYILPVLILIVMGASTTGALAFALQSLCIAPILFTWWGWSMRRSRGRPRLVWEHDESLTGYSK